MPRPSQIDAQRKRLLPIVCQVFSELGYRRTTTAELARRCHVRENILYRLWRDKRAMFLAAIDDIFQSRVDRWNQILAKRPTPRQAVEAMVAYEAKHQGEFGFYRVVFTALVEADDPEIRKAITTMYQRFHTRIQDMIETNRELDQKTPGISSDATAWAIIGLATVSNIIRELKLLRPRQREEMFARTAQYLIQGDSR
ncbi:MAG: TetR/AcrR family transcriptional regulator [Pirellulales bacterium]|nr:TetR/AcrR family transcriptional regulator [Pirellulales bacterium]